MPSWSQLLETIQRYPVNKQAEMTNQLSRAHLQEIATIRGRHAISYYSGFLQKPSAPGNFIQITPEDLNAFMAVMHGMTWAKNLTLVLHTPGGSGNAAETIVSYLREKFDDIEVIVPTFAMSAGTMISLAANQIVMGRQSQLGPIDPQFSTGQSIQSARAVVDQFETAKAEILADAEVARVWYPILQTIGPALLQDSRNALAYGERMVAGWLEEYMFAGQPNAQEAARSAAAYFNAADMHKSHGRRIAREEARNQGLKVEDLEADQRLQDAVLSLYHLDTITVDKSAITKIIRSDLGHVYAKNWQVPQHQIGIQVEQMPPGIPQNQ